MSGNRRRKRTRTRKGVGEEFWGRTDIDMPVPPAIRPAADPSATVRSLGRPPLSGRETVAEHYFAAVYDKAAAAAAALAASVDMLADDDGDD